MTVLHKSDFGDGTYFYETELLVTEGSHTYYLSQQNPSEDNAGEDVVVLDRFQAVSIARAILKSEGIKCD